MRQKAGNHEVWYTKIKLLRHISLALRHAGKGKVTPYWEAEDQS